MQVTAQEVRVLGPADVPLALHCLETEPVTNVFVDYRTRLTQLDRRWLGGEMWGYFTGGELVSMCHVGANLVPVNATEAACTAFARRMMQTRPPSSTVVGPRDAVEAMWTLLQRTWDRPREFRWDQPHLVITGAPQVEPDPLVRRTPPVALETLYPACVAMYTEEVGISPEQDGGRDLYHARVAQLVNRGWSFSRIEDGKVVFKAEIACASPCAAQIQGVYVAPERRGEGLAARGMATVVDIALREVAPAVSLYVNAHNLPARRAYQRVGFEQTATFSTIMF
ncbi:GNAT family N-acetyltransferase [Nocardioides terrisoli]|uniref:GNAT family N-acetyltransferase n=1 Tax=Nocardioides terrisoli TaxID=3388267 RepID=UPI00287B986E|nr:GNAT family N-acetyltransferase [Nocardioides marmorisolisilvae]